MKTYEINFKRIDKTTDIYENILHYADTVEADSENQAINLYLDWVQETASNTIAPLSYLFCMIEYASLSLSAKYLYSAVILSDIIS